MAEVKISRTYCARSEVEIAARPTSAMVVGFFLEPKSFKIPPTKCQWGPIGHLYNLGWSMGSPWWPYGGRLSDPFFRFLPPTSALAKKKSVTSRGVIGPLNRRGSSQGLRNWSQIIFYLTRSTFFNYSGRSRFIGCPAHIAGNRKRSTFYYHIFMPVSQETASWGIPMPGHIVFNINPNQTRPRYFRQYPPG